MYPYNLCLPTNLVFGKGRVSELPDLVRGMGRNVLLAYGGGSIKKIGLYDRVKALLNGFNIVELSGIEPNPKIGSVREGVRLCRENKVDFILAVGGGSVIDCVKNVACGVFYEGDPWDLVLDSKKIGKSLPIVSILTLAATGSEYDGGAVISNPDTHEKLALLGGPSLFPKISILDPEYTFTVSARQTAAGSADIFNHTLESYLVKDGNILTDSICEGMLKTVIKYAPIAIKEPDNYEARAALMQVASFGCNDVPAIGRTPSVWVCHGIEHEVSAWYDITHVVGLAILTPPLMRWTLRDPGSLDRFYQYGTNVWGIAPSDDKMKVANEAIDRTAEFFKSLGLPARLSELGITDEHFGDMADHVLAHWWPLANAMRPVDREGVVEILKMSL